MVLGRPLWLSRHFARIPRILRRQQKRKTPRCQHGRTVNRRRHGLSRSRSRWQLALLRRRILSHSGGCYARLQFTHGRTRIFFPRWLRNDQRRMARQLGMAWRLGMARWLGMGLRRLELGLGLGRGLLRLGMGLGTLLVLACILVQPLDRRLLPRTVRALSVSRLARKGQVSAVGAPF